MITSISKMQHELFGADQQGKPIWVCAGKSERPLEDWEVLAQEGEEFSTSIGARFMNYSGRTGLGLDDAFMHQIATEGALDLAGANYLGPNQILHVVPPPKPWYHHLSAVCKAYEQVARNTSDFDDYDPCAHLSRLMLEPDTPDYSKPKQVEISDVRLDQDGILDTRFWVTQLLLLTHRQTADGHCLVGINDAGPN
ncbi:hypothetical protein EDB81DRAFT_934616 [Dactylonectria macrodidyma]|uniref:Uncharacterized protein n=1 Tax=Dactylonectria macrodidyma TaxID=307937 RepID=A0A9P9J5G1_9HYPO|nr:hypothetical protein EDB81DRAFT_934616 [Dactylonectria macrodidyma]